MQDPQQRAMQKKFFGWKNSLYVGTGLDALLRLVPTVTGDKDINTVIDSIGMSDVAIIVGTTVLVKGVYNLAYDLISRYKER